jgi:hypothetical protein
VCQVMRIDRPACASGDRAAQRFEAPEMQA